MGEIFNYQNFIDGGIDEVKITDYECQQIGGHFWSWLKNCLQHIMTVFGNSDWFCIKEIY